MSPFGTRTALQREPVQTANVENLSPEFAGVRYSFGEVDGLLHGRLARYLLIQLPHQGGNFVLIRRLHSAPREHSVRGPADLLVPNNYQPAFVSNCHSPDPNLHTIDFVRLGRGRLTTDSV